MTMRFATSLLFASCLALGALLCPSILARGADPLAPEPGVAGDDLRWWRTDASELGGSIPAQGFLLVAKNPAALAPVAGIPKNAIAGPYFGKLSNFKDELVLSDATGKIVETVAYEQDGVWPARADGLGSSLQRVSSEAPGHLPQNWAVYSDPRPASRIPRRGSG